MSLGLGIGLDIGLLGGGSSSVATPAFSLATGSYGGSQSVTLSCATTGAAIYYTTDGSTPSASSTLYSSAITVSSTTTIKAIGIKSGLPDSQIATSTYTLSVFTDRLNGETFALVVSPAAIVKSWAEASRPTVYVEKGYGSGVFQNLYPYTDGKLYTGALGTGTEASVWAAGAKLLVEIPYNQCAADLVTGHPTKLSNDKRVLLDVSTPNAPFFAGYSTGTQDASQHATQRGYSITQTLKTNNAPTSMVALHQHAASETTYLIQDSTTGTTRYWLADGTLRRQYDAWAVAVANYQSATVPNFIQNWSVNDGRGIASEENKRTGVGGIFNGDTFLVATSGTTYNLNIMGPTNSLQGKLFALMMTTAAMSPASMLFGGIPSKMSGVSTNAVAADNPSIVFPYANATIPMDLDTELADIPIKLFGKPNKSYEARWQAGAYATIGTTDANGVLSGALTNQSRGNGTIDVREVGGSTPLSITNVAVGIVMLVHGESDPDGRNDNVTHTIPTGYLRKDRANWTAASNEWWKLACQGLYDAYGVGTVISVVKATAGSTLTLNGATEGHWSTANTTSNPAMVAQAGSKALSMSVDFLTPNFSILQLGKNDASAGTSAVNFTTRIGNLLSALRTKTGNNSFFFDVIGIDNNTGVAAANTDAIRLAMLGLVDGTNYKMGGSFAHLPTTEAAGVHLKTQAEKQAAANVFLRNKIGTGGRAPRYSSIAAPTSTTIEITLTGGVSPMTISASSDVTGWSVTDGGGANAVTAVNVSGLVVTLTLTRARSGTSTVKWASASTSIGTTLLDSDATTPLPPEPFEATV